MIRKCHEGYRIGPLFADNTSIAEQLFVALCSSVEDDKIFIDVPEVNSAGLKIVESYHFTPSFETARMYTQHALDLDVSRMFGVTSLELG